jgi:DNA polymerase III epsilon subunit-like protein
MERYLLRITSALTTALSRQNTSGSASPFAMDRLCTVRLSRHLYPDQKRHNLDTVLARHNIKVENRHRALDDAQALFEFYKIALQQHDLNLFAAMDKLLVKAKI